MGHPVGHGKPTELEGGLTCSRTYRDTETAHVQGLTMMYVDTGTHTHRNRDRHRTAQRNMHRHAEIQKDAETQSHTESQGYTQDTRRLTQTDTQRDIQTYAPQQLCDPGTRSSLSETQSYHLSNGHHNFQLVMGQGGGTRKMPTSAQTPLPSQPASVH